MNLNATRLLSLDKVNLSGPNGAPLLSAADWDIYLGRLQLVHVDSAPLGGELADCLQGLVAPQAGAVRFLEQDWQRLTPAIAARQRRLVRRVFAGTGWVSNLNIDENILLGHGYDNNEPAAVVRRRAGQLAERLGLTGLDTLTARPAQHHSDHELQLAQWLRALLYPGRLLLLESPLDHIRAHTWSRLQRELGRLLAQGTAVVWLAAGDDALTPNRLGITADEVYRLRDGRLTAEPPHPTRQRQRAAAVLNGARHKLPTALQRRDLF